MRVRASRRSARFWAKWETEFAKSDGWRSRNRRTGKVVGKYCWYPILQSHLSKSLLFIRPMSSIARALRMLSSSFRATAAARFIPVRTWRRLRLKRRLTFTWDLALRSTVELTSTSCFCLTCSIWTWCFYSFFANTEWFCCRRITMPLSYNSV